MMLWGQVAAFLLGATSRICSKHHVAFFRDSYIAFLQAFRQVQLYNSTDTAWKKQVTGALNLMLGGEPS